MFSSKNKSRFYTEVQKKLPNEQKLAPEYEGAAAEAQRFSQELERTLGDDLH